MGNIPAARKYIKSISDKNLIIELAFVCENTKNIFEAAQLYEKAE